MIRRWLTNILARIGITIHAHEIAIKFRRHTITIKLERNDPNEETQRHIEKGKPK